MEAHKRQELLDKTKPCADYPDVMQMSKRCQNCRWNHFVDGCPSKQICRPHTQKAAQLKGAPTEVPAEEVEKRMRDMMRRQMEEEIKALQ